MHELGLRILIRKVQLIGAQYEKALTPIFSYYKDHYFRAFFSCEKSKLKADEIITKHQYFHYCNKCLSFEISKKNEIICCENPMELAGPLWVGELNDKELLRKMVSENNFAENSDFLNQIILESEKDIVGFYNLHKYSQKYKTSIPRTEDALKKLKQKGFFAEKTIFDIYGIRTDAKIKDFLELVKK